MSFRPFHRPSFTALAILCGTFWAAGPWEAWGADDKEAEVKWAVEAEINARVLEKNPQDEMAWAKLVHARVAARDFARAEKALADWRAKVPKPAADLDRSRAELAFAREQWADAVEAWKAYLQAKPKDAAAWLELAEAHEKMRQWPEAIGAVSEAIALRPSAPDLARRAGFHVRRHDWAKAEADVREADRLDATDPAVQALLPVFDRAKEWKSTVTKLDAALAEKPDDVSLRLDRAEWLIGIGLNEAANDDIEAAWKTNPQSLRARVWRGIMAWERGRQDEKGDVMEWRLAQVDAAYERELKAADRSTDSETRAAFLVRRRQPLLALGELRELDGSPIKAHALLMLKRIPEAGLAARRAVEIHPKDAGAWLVLARVELENGNIREALAALDRSIKINPAPEAVSLQKDTQRRLGKK